MVVFLWCSLDILEGGLGGRFLLFSFWLVAREFVWFLSDSLFRRSVASLFNIFTNVLEKAMEGKSPSLQVVLNCYGYSNVASVAGKSRRTSQNSMGKSMTDKL